LVAVTRPAGALLGIHLLRRGGDFRPALALVRALLAARQLPHHAALQDVLADRHGEHAIGEIDLAGAAAPHGFDRDLHCPHPYAGPDADGPSAAGASPAGAAGVSAAGAAGSAALRRPAGYGASFGRARFEASLTMM